MYNFFLVLFQVHTFYEAVGLMISACADQTQQERLIEKYMSLPNQVWDELINMASNNVEVIMIIVVVEYLGTRRRFDGL